MSILVSIHNPFIEKSRANHLKLYYVLFLMSNEQISLIMRSKTVRKFFNSSFVLSSLIKKYFQPYVCVSRY